MSYIYAKLKPSFLLHCISNFRLFYVYKILIVVPDI